MKHNMAKVKTFYQCQACMKALENGVAKTHIIDGRISHCLLLEIFTKDGIGTEIVK